MEQETIFYLGLFLIGVFVICDSSWFFSRNNLSSGWQSALIITGFISLAIGSAFIYEFSYNIFAGSSSPKNLFDEALSNIHRNKIILSFAIFGGCLAIWARIVSQKQLEKSIQMNRNDRFAKAVELINDKNSTITTRGGFRMLRDLTSENRNEEYIRCVEIISHWLIEDGKEMLKIENKTISKIMKDNLLDMAIGIFRIKIDGKIQKKIRKYMKDNDWDFWPILQGVYLGNADLQGAYLQGAYLRYAHFQKANLKNANLQGSDLTRAFMSEAKNLTKEQILSAKWFAGDSNGKPPILSEKLMKDPDVQKWLSKPSE